MFEPTKTGMKGQGRLHTTVSKKKLLKQHIRHKDFKNDDKDLIICIHVEFIRNKKIQ